MVPLMLSESWPLTLPFGPTGPAAPAGPARPGSPWCPVNSRSHYKAEHLKVQLYAIQHGWHKHFLPFSPKPGGPASPRGPICPSRPLCPGGPSGPGSPVRRRKDSAHVFSFFLLSRSPHRTMKMILSLPALPFVPLGPSSPGWPICPGGPKNKTGWGWGWGWVHHFCRKEKASTHLLSVLPGRPGKPLSPAKINA